MWDDCKLAEKVTIVSILDLIQTEINRHEVKTGQEAEYIYLGRNQMIKLFLSEGDHKNKIANNYSREKRTVELMGIPCLEVCVGDHLACS